MAYLENIPRPEKLEVARKIHANLVARQAAGPAEPALDAYIPDIAGVIGRLETHVHGSVNASTARQVQLARLDVADIEVDTWYRHIEGFLHVEAHRRAGPNVIAARAVYAAACPDGLAHVDDRVPEENAYCRNLLSVLRDPANAATLAALELPLVWLDRLQAALDASDAALRDLAAARQDKSTHTDLGRDVEEDWVDLMDRLRRYVDTRASRHDAVKRAESEALLGPLLVVIKKLRADAAARRTRRTKQEAPPSGTENAPSA